MSKKLPELPFFGQRVEVYKNIDSTIDRAREIINDSPDVALIAAFSQDNGVGRRGSSWFSPEGGLYFSIIVRVKKAKAIASVRAAFYALKSLEDLGIEAHWKWPNDIICSGGKAGGIIAQSPAPGWLILSVGLNTFKDKKSFPESVRDSAAVCPVDKKQFLSGFLKDIKQEFPVDKLSSGEIDYLNSRLTLTARQCRVGDIQGTVRGIDEKGALLVESSGGKTTSVLTGSPIPVKKAPVPEDTLILVDAGNTSTRIGLMTSGEITKTGIVPSGEGYLDSLEKKINSITGGKKAAGSAFSCVVRSLEGKLKKTLEKYSRTKPLKISHKAVSGLKLKVKDPSQLGPDRICNAAAVYHIYGYDCIVADLGTANTFDIVSCSGEYIGGVICPGIESMAADLIKRADRIKSACLGVPEKIAGTTTEEAVKSGLHLTLTGQIEKTINEIRKELNRDFRIIFTGGAASSLPLQVTQENPVDIDITLKGMAVIWGLTNKSNLL